MENYPHLELNIRCYLPLTDYAINVGENWREARVLLIEDKSLVNVIIAFQCSDIDLLSPSVVLEMIFNPVIND